MDWEKIDFVLGECEKPTINNLFSMVDSRIDCALEDVDVSERDKLILQKVRNLLYGGWY